MSFDSSHYHKWDGWTKEEILAHRAQGEIVLWPEGWDDKKKQKEDATRKLHANMASVSEQKNG